MGQQFLLEIEGRPQAKLKNGAFLRRFDFSLGSMQRQRTHILSLNALYPYLHTLYGTMHIDDNPERFGKIGLRIEIIGHDERMVGRSQRMDTVERINADIIIIQTAGHDIPPQMENLDTIGSHFERTSRIVPKALIGQHQRPTLPHGLDDLR